MKKEFEMQCNVFKIKYISLNLAANYQEMLLSKELILFDRGDLSRHKILQ